MSSKISVFKLPAVDFRQFALISIFFFFGSLLGVVTAGYIEVNAVNSVALSLLNNDNGFIVDVFKHFKFHLAVIILGASVFGVFLIPLFSAVKGFSLSFTASCVFSFVNTGSFSGDIFVFYIFQTFSNFILILIMLNSVSSSGLLFKAVFLNKDYLRRENIIRNFKYCSVFMLSLFILYFLLFYIL